MEELIKIHNQGSDLRADSRDVATLLGIDHESLLIDLDRHPRELEALGVFRLEGGKPSSPQGGRPPKFAYLNFEQILYLLTITRTTAQTREYRVRLIIAFRDARNRFRPIDQALLTIPDTWKRTFHPDFYEALLRLYGAKFASMGDTPSWVGKWTNHFIYEPLFDRLPLELKSRRKAHVGDGSEAWLKLHQFIEEHAKVNLDKHLIKVTGLLEASTSPQHFLELFGSVFYGQKQLLLGGSNIPPEFT